MNSYDGFANSYDLLTSNVDYQKRGNYFHQILLQHGKQSGILLDLACGTGTLSEFFARLNYDVIGVDASEEMLNVAMEKKCESQSDIIYLKQNMQDLDLFGTVDIVICALDSFNHIVDEQELRQVFERISLFLNEDSLLIFDMNTVYKHEHILNNQTYIYDLDEVYCVWQNTLLDHHIVEIHLDIFEYEEESNCYYREQEHFYERAYTREQICFALDKAGFELLKEYDEDSFQPPLETSQRVVYVARNLTCKNAVPKEDNRKELD